MIQKIKILLSLLIWVFYIQLTTNAQNSTYYFSDREQKEDGTIMDCCKGDDCMYVAGNTFEKENSCPIS